MFSNTMSKTRKTFSKRFKLTRRKKILHRQSGLGHGFVKQKRVSKKKLLKQAPEIVLNYLEYHQ